MLEEINNKIINEITELVNQTRTNIAREINKSINYVYWNNLVSNENKFNNRLGLSYELTKSFIKRILILKKSVMN